MSKKIIGIIIIAVLVIITLLNTCVVIPSGKTGVISNFGAVSDNVLDAGLRFKTPFISKVVKMDNRVKKVEIEFSSSSKDLQIITGVSSMNYNLKKESSAEIYKNFGKNIESILITPIIPECIKAVTAVYSAEELVTKRQEVSELMKQKIAEKVAPYGVAVREFNLTDFDFSAEFNAAIEAKQTAQQQALKAEQDLARIKVEAEQKIEQARAEAEAYKLKSHQLTPEMIQMEFINKWNGKLPTVVSDGSKIMDIGSMIGK